MAIRLGDIQDAFGASTISVAHGDSAGPYKMSHFRIEQITDNSSYVKEVFCTGNDEGWGTPHYTHNSPWRNMTNATWEDDCDRPIGTGHGSNDLQGVVTLMNSMVWTNWNANTANKMLLQSDFYQTNNMSSMVIDHGTNFASYTDSNEVGPYACCYRLGGEDPYADTDVFYYNYAWADGINNDATGYGVEHQVTLTMS